MIEFQIFENSTNQERKMVGESLVSITDIIDKKDFSIKFTVNDDDLDAVLYLSWNRNWADEEKKMVQRKKNSTLKLESDLNMVN